MRLRAPAATCVAPIVFALVAFALLPASCAIGQTETATSRLDSIEVTGSSRFPSAQFAAATGLQVGTQVSRDDLQKAANTLAQLGPFITVNYRFSTAMPACALNIR